MKIITRQSTLIQAFIIATVFLIGNFTLSLPMAHADGGLSVTITPPLVQLAIAPGQVWSSVLKIVNNNTFDVTYYTQVVDMQPDGESGRSKFIPIINEPKDSAYQSFALARWITRPPAPILIHAGESANVSYSIHVPVDAEPGGHYAAILIGTEPGTFNQQGALMKVSSFVSSLIFIQIKGDVKESGRIREFSTSKSLFQTSSVDFTLRFENTGNTHVHPQGDVTIYNMWGKSRGQVLINNQDADFGNVLPASIRKFQFSWTGEQNIFDIGPYSAVVTLDYGSDGKQSVSATTYFWIVPVVPVAIGIGSIILFMLLITWFIRRYVRRALMLEKSRIGIPPQSSMPAVHNPVIETLMEPLREGIIDLRNVRGKGAAPAAQQSIQAGAVSYQHSLTPYQFFIKYRLFIVFLVVLITGTTIGARYFAKVLESHRGYQIHDVNTANETVPQK